MLPLKYLNHDVELYKNLLNHWSHDENQKDLVDNFRISSNAIYPFYNKQQVQFLRFAPAEEKPLAFINGEISFIEFLSLNGLNVPAMVPSISGEKIIHHTYKGINYRAITMTNVGGTRLDRLHLSNALLFKYGGTLARLHQVSMKNTARFNRPSYKNAFSFIRDKLNQWPYALEALKELELLFESFPHCKTEFGLIHYDFELDNVFFLFETDEMAIIDFDDSLYHFYAMDLVKSLANLEAESLEMKRSAQDIQQFKNAFIAGYTAILPLPTLYKTHENAFERFQTLLTCARMHYALETASQRSEDWAIGLIERFRHDIKEALSVPLKPL